MQQLKCKLKTCVWETTLSLTIQILTTMSSENIYTLIDFDSYSITPKYLQLANAITKGIEENKIEQGYILPSINNMGYELDISRNTVEKAYKHLKEKKIIHSVPGKGYYIQTSHLQEQTKIFLLFNKLSVHKKIIYDELSRALGHNVIIDFYIYNNDFPLFKKLLSRKKMDYSYYVIIPHFLGDEEKAHEVINAHIPVDKLILMSRWLPGINGNYSAVYEDFENNIYDALSQAIDKLKNYEKLNIIFPEYTYHTPSILQGFARFCQDYAFDYEIIRNVKNISVEANSVYISLMEDDLVVLIKKILPSQLKVGADVGIISYNETPIKEIILNGITTMSADFKAMGEKTAELILSKKTEHYSVPFHLTLRNSL